MKTITIKLTEKQAGILRRNCKELGITQQGIGHISTAVQLWANGKVQMTWPESDIVDYKFDQFCQGLEHSDRLLL